MMYIIFSPTKTIKQNGLNRGSKPKFLNEFKIIKNILKNKSDDELSVLYKVDKEKIKDLNLFNKIRTTAFESYNGLTFKQLNNDEYDAFEYEYINTHIRILSAAYGVLKPFDTIEKYRLDFKMKFDFDLYDFWTPYVNSYFKNDFIIDLASSEYSKLVDSKNKYIIDFLCFDKDKYVRKATISKMMRGKILHEMIVNNIQTLDEIKKIKIFNFEFFKEEKGVLTFKQII